MEEFEYSVILFFMTRKSQSSSIELFRKFRVRDFIWKMLFLRPISEKLDSSAIVNFSMANRAEVLISASKSFISEGNLFAVWQK